MDWGSFDNARLGFYLHIVCWFLSYVIIIYVLYRLRQGYLCSRLVQSRYSCLKAACLVLVGIVVQIIILNVFPDKDSASYTNSVMAAFNSRFGLLSVMTATVLAPILEELTFRGIFQERLTVYGHSIGAVVISSVVFSYCHVFTINTQFWMIFVQGLIFSWLYQRSRNLKYPIFAHILTNSIVAILNYL